MGNPPVDKKIHIPPVDPPRPNPVRELVIRSVIRNVGVGLGSSVVVGGVVNDMIPVLQNSWVVGGGSS